MTRKLEGRQWTLAEKQRAIEIYYARGDRSISDVVAEIGCSKPLLYSWIHRHKNGIPLDKRLAAKEAKVRPKGRRKALGSIATSITRSTSTRPVTIDLDAAPSASRLAPNERDELVLLRAEVRRLRRTLSTILDLGGA